MSPNLMHEIAGATLVTANARLARELTLAYDRGQAGSGAAVWEAADILPWSAWLRRCWRNRLAAEGGGEAVLLSPAQEELLWERVIEESEGSDGLLNLPGTAAAAREAYALLHCWEVPLSDPLWELFEDAAAFRRWALQVERLLQAGAWVSPARLEAEIAERIGRGQIQPPARFLHAGFYEPAPAQRNVLRALRAAGCRVEELQVQAAPSPSVMRVQLPDAMQELQAAARWARARLEASPGARIGVVVPDLKAACKKTERIFSQTLEPNRFHISAGPALTGIPVVAAALMILALGRGRISAAEAGLLLRSPFLAGAGLELGRRALLDADLRRRGLAEVSLARLAREAGAKAPKLARRLRGLRRALAILSAWRGTSRWSRAFSRLLRVAGWPGDRTPDSAEYQAIERWNDLLSEFAALESVSSPMDYSSALSRLRRMAAETAFAPADEQVPVQVMGVLEAAGSVFDHLWVAGLEDRVWPAPPRPHPFLPPPLQRTHGLPHSSAERELAYARLITGRLLASAPEVVVSCPMREADTDLRPSPLIRELPEGEPPTAASAPRAARPELEVLEDGLGPPLPPGAEQRGGTGILQKQSACPFRAFAEYRLEARPLEEPAAGFSPLERGLVLHSALEALWGELKSHAALTSSTEEQLEAVIGRSVRQAIAKQVRGRGVESMTRVQSLEQRRLEKLLKDWLEIERARSPFEVVAGEHQRRISIGGLELDIKVDRVDALEDGRQVIIDYKSGEANQNQWEGDRPDAPQLPLYAATHGGAVGAVAFARLAPGDAGFLGLGEGAGIPGVAEYGESRPGKAAGGTLADHIGGWRAVVERLAREFSAGTAAVTPKNAKACQACPLPALCRIGDLAPRMEPEDANE